MAICSIRGCNHQNYALGVCEMHYQRLRLTGTLEPGGKAHGPLEDRFRRKFSVGAPDECWEWQGGISKNGYGVIQRGGADHANASAHRVSFELHKGPIPDGMLVLHSCDNRKCVNPNHLRIGTQAENIKQAFARKRKINPVKSGEDNPRSKLTAEQVAFIRAHPEMKHTELAQLFGLSPNCIRGVRIGRTWK